MDLREQKYVCALAEYGNITKAAESLYISQPGLSLFISNLEKSLGFPLFARKGRRFILTYAGERYVEKARRMLELEAEFNREVYAIQLEQVGRIRLGISQRRGAWLIPPVVAAYEKAWPEIDLVIREGNLTDINEMLKNSELDILILNRSDVAEDMVIVPLFQEEFLVAVPPRHPINKLAEYVPDSRYRRIAPEALNGQTLILHTPWQSSRNIEDDILHRHQVVPGKIRIMRSMETAIQMVAEELGISFIREGYAVHMKYKRPVNYYTLDTESHRREVVAAYRKDVQLPAYMQGLLDILQEQSRHFLEE